MSDGSVIATPRKTKFDIDQEALTNTYNNNDFGLIPENEWSAVDAATMGMSTPEILRRRTSDQSGVIETVIDENYVYPGEPTGTDTSSGNREAPAPVVRDRMENSSELERYKAFVGANPALAAKVKPGQAGYDEIQQILGNNSGGIEAAAEDAGRTVEDMTQIRNGGLETVIGGDSTTQTASTPATTSNPESPEDGTSAAPDVFDQSRSLSIPGIDPQEFLNKKVRSISDILAGETNPDRFIFKD